MSVMCRLSIPVSPAPRAHAFHWFHCVAGVVAQMLQWCRVHALHMQRGSDRVTVAVGMLLASRVATKLCSRLPRCACFCLPMRSLRLDVVAPISQSRFPSGAVYKVCGRRDAAIPRAHFCAVCATSLPPWLLPMSTDDCVVD